MTVEKDTRYEGFFLVRQSEQRAASNGSRYLDMTLGDKSGEINAKLWDGSVPPPPIGAVVKARGLMQEYNGRMQFRVEKMRQAEPQDKVDISLLTHSAPEDPQVMADRVTAAVEGMQNPDIRAICRQMLKMAGDHLYYFPAAQKLHHAERAGLLHHITGMLSLCDAMLPLYPFLNADLLRAGIILHDLAKITEMKSDIYGVVSDYSPDGLLVGHLVRGVAMLAQAAQSAGVQGEAVLLLEHMIISHHNEPEYGSPRRPMFPEAELLHWIDLVDARINEMRGILARTPPGAFSEKIWSLDRRVYHPAIDAKQPD
ncbi:MAG: HD domain-containing protein [Clostridia bacterium]|nr:HD domain-containing protein [Clostridia bacterium]